MISALGLSTGKGEVADSGGELRVQSFYPKVSRPKQQPSPQERKLHTSDHPALPSWSGSSQEAEGRAFQQSARTSMMHLDYAYIQQPQDAKPTTILTWVESLTGLAGSLMTTEKGHTAHQLDAVIYFLTRNGFASSTLQCDGEPALVQLVEEIGKQTNLPLDRSPACSNQHEAWQKSLFAQFRALLLDFCHRYKLHPSQVMIGSSLGKHMLRHAEWLLNRFQLSSSDNKTSFHRRWGIAFTSAVIPFGELVLAQDQSLAFWLGRCEATDQHILAKLGLAFPPIANHELVLVQPPTELVQDPDSHALAA